MTAFYVHKKRVDHPCNINNSLTVLFTNRYKMGHFYNKLPISEHKMKHQQVNVDYWAMLQSMFTYGVLSILCWVMLRLFHAVFTLPRRLRSQQENIQNTLQELQKRFPDLNITEEDLENAEKELEELTKESDAERNKSIENMEEKDKCTEKLEEKNKSIENLEEKTDTLPEENKKDI